MNIKCKVANRRFMPKRMHAADAGADMRANIEEPMTIPKGKIKWIDLGASCDIPEGYVGILAARSGLGCKHGITLANGIGVIDSGYQGPNKAALVNLGDRDYTIRPHDRVCQLLIIKCELADFTEVDEFEAESERGDGGYGSTGNE